MVVIVIAFIFGVVLGCIAAYLLLQSRSIGTLRIDESDPDGSLYFFLELSTQPEVVKRKKHVVLRVNPQSYIPQD